MIIDIESFTPRMLSVLRIVTGLLFLEHGTAKLLGFPLSQNPGPAVFSLLGSGLIQIQNAMMAARTTADKKLRASLS